MHCPYPLYCYFFLRKAGSGKSRCCLPTAISSTLPNSILRNCLQMSHNNTISCVSLRTVTPSHSKSPHQARMGLGLTMLLTMQLAEKSFGNTKLWPQNNTRSCLFSAFSTPAADSPACPSSNYISSLWVLPHHSFIVFFFISLYSDIAKKITPFKAVPLRQRV